MKKLVISFALLALLVLPVLVFGQDDPPALIKSVSELCQFIQRIVTVVFSIIMIIAVIFILLAAFNYLTAGGSGEKVETATKQLTNAIIAIVIAVLAYSIPMVVAGFLYRGAGQAEPGTGIFRCASGGSS